MRPEPRAVVFDLDDTLYAQRRFVLSGFAAVARYLEAEWWIPARVGFAALTGAYRSAARGRELQACLREFKLPETLTGTLVDIIRAHTPALRLPRDSREALGQLRDGWRLAIVTNGRPDIQRRKVEALGLRPFVDTVIYAAECGTGAGKPAPEAFVAALTQLGVAPGRAVFVGDSEVCDVRGGAGVGLWTIRLDRTSPAAPPSPCAAATLRSIREVPTVAARLVDPAWSRDVA